MYTIHPERLTCKDLEGEGEAVYYPPVLVRQIFTGDDDGDNVVQGSLCVCVWGCWGEGEVVASSVVGLPRP